MTRYWVGVTSAEHVHDAVAGGFFQANHGKEAPLRRIGKGDRVLFYSPRETIRGGAPVQAFTAIGEVLDEAPYRADQSPTFKPFRRDVRYADARPAPIRELLDRLSFSRGKSHWGQVMRRGFFEMDEADFAIVAAAMGIETTTAAVRD